MKDVPLEVRIDEFGQKATGSVESSEEVVELQYHDLKNQRERVVERELNLSYSPKSTVEYLELTFRVIPENGEPTIRTVTVLQDKHRGKSAYLVNGTNEYSDEAYEIVKRATRTFTNNPQYALFAERFDEVKELLQGVSRHLFEQGEAIQAQRHAERRKEERKNGVSGLGGYDPAYNKELVDSQGGH